MTSLFELNQNWVPSAQYSSTVTAPYSPFHLPAAMAAS